MTTVALRQYTTALIDLIERRKLPGLAIRRLRQAAQRLGGAPDTPVAVLTRDHLRDAVGAHLAGELDCSDLGAWSQVVFDRLSYLHTGGKPLSAEIGHQIAVYTAVKHLAAAKANIDTETLASIIAILDIPDHDPNREWTEEETTRWEAMMDLDHPGLRLRAEQGLEAALLEAEIRGIDDPHPVRLFLARCQSEPEWHRPRPLEDGEMDMVAFELCATTWMIRPSTAPGIAELARACLGRVSPAAHITHERGEFRRLDTIEDAEPIPQAVADILPLVLAEARASGLSL
jgi:hypothetical protein